MSFSPQIQLADFARLINFYIIIILIRAVLLSTIVFVSSVKFSLF